MHVHRHHVAPGRRPQRGLSLIELMVSLTLGLFLIAGMLSLLARNSNDRSELDKAGRQVESGRYAMQRLSEDIHHAGYYGEYLANVAPGSGGFPTTLPEPCEDRYWKLFFKRATALPLQGVTAVVPAALAAAGLSCIGSANIVAGSNVLVLRFASPLMKLPTPPASSPLQDWGADAGAMATLDADVAYVQANVEDLAFATAADSAASFPLTVSSGSATNLVKAPVYRYITRIYFLSPCSRPAAGTNCSAAADNGSPIPSLKMVELGAGAAGAGPAFTAPITVAEGVEQLRFDYGLDTNDDGSPDNFVDCSACSLEDWYNVVAVRINLLARNTDPSPGFTDSKSYALGQASNLAFTPAGAAQRYKRHAYQMQVRVNNTSMRRE